MKRFLLAVCLVFTLRGALAAAPPDAEGVAFFEKKIRPVLVQHCYQCHSETARQSKKLRGGLLLDSREGVLRGGDSGPALLPGKVHEGHLLAALRYAGDVKMPPAGRLPDEIVADFVRWVELGLPDPRQSATPTTAKAAPDVEQGRQYWAFRPFAQAEPPPLPGDTWSQTAVDRFLVAKLRAKGLTPSPPAERAKLVRRAYFDLWGLPPTPAEVEAFVNDPAPAAYERLLDRLLDSPHYGERWARHWLDVVRFAESGGYEFDKDRPGAYHYRDFVIKALNDDLPYDEFVRLQLAGDHLRPGDYFATAATGFLVAGPFPGQMTAKTRELIRYNHLDDMVSTLGTSLLGLSLGCARCHDHKYDPLPQKDYYRLVASLGRTDSADLQLDPEPEATRRAQAAFAKAHAPFAARRAQFEKEQLPGRAAAWWAKNQNSAAPRWLLDPTEVTGATVKRPGDGSVLVAAKPGKNEVYTIIARTEQQQLTGLRLDVLADAALPKSGPGRGADGGFLLTELALTATPADDPKAKPKPVKLRALRASSEAKGRPLSATLDTDKKSGWTPAALGKDATAIYAIDGKVGFAGGAVLTLTLKFEGDGAALGRFRAAFTTTEPTDGPALPQHATELRTVLGGAEGKVTAQNRLAVGRWLRGVDAVTEKELAAEEAHARQAPQPALTTVFAAASGRGGDVYFLTRGEVERKAGKAEPGFLQVLMTTTDKDQHWLGEGASAPTATVIPETKGPRPARRPAAPKMTPAASARPIPGPRVALADWLTDSEKGAGRLLARVIVNRLWQHHLGRGLVATPNDFGVQGEPPTHPELLDWLAADLVHGGWKLKRLHKQIMTSAVYRQGGELNPAAQAIDPQNKLWWRRPPRRLEAEAIRDALLAVGGTLDRTLYGPGPLDASSPRRSIYLKVKRSQLVPMLQMYDAPEAIQSVGERPTTTVATQSLAMLNSTLVRTQAAGLARRAHQPGGELDAAIAEAYRLALARRPTDAERERLTAFVRQQALRYGGPQAQVQALTDGCQVLLCLNEFVYID